ncbi:MAG: substrate-binding domain-containing protein [Pyrinomonadaceae bacterium]|nr:substrate-binding domain-containing protein [Pyrinomonadaceae bacterium]
MKKLTLCLLLFSMFLGLIGCGSNNTNAKKYTIAVIPKGTTHSFWKSINAGAVKAANDYKSQGIEVEIIWKGPLKEDDREQQVQVVEGFVSQNVSGMVLAPLDDKALVRPVEEAKRAGIPTVIMDSGLQSEQITSFVATDNKKGGAMAADRLGEVLGGKGKVIMLRYAEGSASTTDREEGFLQEMKTKFPNIEIISADQYAGATRDTAKRASENLLQRFGNDVNGIFTSNESASTGMLLALQDMGKAGKVSFVGFDATPQFIEAMKNNQMQGVVLQNPFKIGELGVKAMVDSILGKQIEKRVDTGAMMVTPENMNTPEAQKLLNPPV